MGAADTRVCPPARWTPCGHRCHLRQPWTTPQRAPNRHTARLHISPAKRMEMEVLHTRSSCEVQNSGLLVLRLTVSGPRPLCQGEWVWVGRRAGARALAATTRWSSATCCIGKEVELNAEPSPFAPVSDRRRCCRLEKISFRAGMENVEREKGKVPVRLNYFSSNE
jgi:hypothetical protein